MHPGETTSSWALHGLIIFLLSKSKVANKLRSKTVFKIFPILNLDGVIAGNTRTSLAGLDMNRMFEDKANKRLNPEAKMLREYAKKEVRP